MGTHPIFESDFDCLTDLISVRQRNVKSQQRDFVRSRRGGHKGLEGQEAQVSRDDRAPDHSEELRSPEGQAFLWNRQVSRATVATMRIYRYLDRKGVYPGLDPQS